MAHVDSLITGGSGFIGQHLCRRLCEKGQSVHDTSRSGSLTRMSDLVGRLVQISGSKTEPDFGALPDRPNENAITADISLAEKQLGWRATTTLDEGLRQTVDWYRFKAEGPAAAGLCASAS